VARQKKLGSYDAFLIKNILQSIPTSLLTGEWTYDKLQQLADQYLDCPIQDLCGLDTENDPFYCGSPAQKAKAEWIASYWPQIMEGRKQISIRSVFYWLGSMAVPFPEGYKGGKRPDGSVMECFENNATCLSLCNIAIKYARYLGLISSNDIMDEKTSAPLDFTGYEDGDVDVNVEYGIASPELPSAELDALVLPSAPSLEFESFDVPQMFHRELWSEKSTINYLMEPLAEQYKAVYQDLSGESSATRVREAAERIVKDGRPARIGYISDYDPAGENMVRAMAVKLQYELIKLGSDIDVRVYILALTQKQVEQHGLKLIDLKSTEKRAKSFAAKHGQDDEIPKGTELDAIEATHKGLLVQIVSEWLNHFYDTDHRMNCFRAQWAYEKVLEKATKEALAPMAPRMDDFRTRYKASMHQVISILTPLIEERDELWTEAEQRLQAKSNDLPPVSIPEPQYPEDEPSIPLYDSNRHRLVQNLFWQAHKRNEPLESVQKRLLQAGLNEDMDTDIA
jgi:hypothetical protein